MSNDVPRPNQVLAGALPLRPVSGLDEGGRRVLEVLPSFMSNPLWLLKLAHLCYTKQVSDTRLRKYGHLIAKTGRV